MRTAEVKIPEMGCTIECVTKIPELYVNDKVLVEQDKIIYLGTVSRGIKVFTDESEINTTQLSCFIIRKLFPFETGEKFIHYKIEAEGFEFCKKNAEELNLLMKLLKVRHMPLENKLVFYYSAEERVDFRELVKILAARFHLRIEMRQINIRDECKILGGIGVCGRICCCSSIVGEMNTVTSKITKLQCQNTSKFTGYCGRLLCCLAFDPPVHGEDICKDKYASDVQNHEESQVKTKISDEAGMGAEEIHPATIKDDGYEK